MNTHDKLELPPLPDLPAYSSEVFDREVKVVSETMAEQLMHDYALAAIEPYKQRIEELEAQLEAIGAGGVSGQPITSQRRGESYNPRKPTEEEWRRLTENGRKAWGEKDTEPVRVPSKLSNAEIMSLAYDVGAMPEQMTDGSLLTFARALLARYGQPVEPEGWQLVPKELMRLMPEVLASLKGSGVDVSLAADVERALAAAPKFGEEE